MQSKTRYEALTERHRGIDRKLAAEMKRPLPDMMVLQRLKRQKLLVKDEIESWKRLMGAIRVNPPQRADEALG